MARGEHASSFDLTHPIDLTGAAFSRHKYALYPRLLEEAPVYIAKISILKVHLISRYADCRDVLSDARFVRNRARAKAGKAAGEPTSKGSVNPFPFPLPKAVTALAKSMIVEDDPEHRRLRDLVNKAFTLRAVDRLSDRVETLSSDLLDRLERKRRFDLVEDYARPIPTRVIAEMMGIRSDQTAELQRGLGVLTKGLSGFGLVRTLLWDLRRTSKFIRRLVDEKRREPRDDILSALILVEEGGDRLSEDELVAMAFLLMIAGFETTLHLITNSVRHLLEVPEEAERLRAEPSLWESAVEELIRFRGPIHGTKLMYPTEDVQLQGVLIRQGTPVMPLLGAANFDPRAFDHPERFEITRDPNHHLGFGFGSHFCLGRRLAQMETRIALKNLVDRAPNLRLDIDPERLELARTPGWHRYLSLPVALD